MANETPVGPETPPPKKYYGRFTAEGMVQGFWNDDVYPSNKDGSRNDRIPADAVEITEAVWQDLLRNPGTSKYVDGAVVYFTRDPIPPSPPSYVDLLLFEYENRLRSLEGKPPMSMEDFTAKSRK